MDLRTDLNFFDVLSGSYRRLIGRPLVPNGMLDAQAAQWLYSEAPFAILAHNTEADPIFVYGNEAAQRLFEYTWEELTKLPSRLSAEAPDRAERAQFLERVRRDGYIRGYRGIRVSKSGKRFPIENATVWQLIDSQGIWHGQAALLPTERAGIKAVKE
jgi:PAS domain S-box-containing protein